MYGTVGVFTLKDGTYDQATALFDEWDRDMRPKIDGAVAGLTYRLDSDPNKLIIAAVFENKKKYFANADNPEQDKWYQRMAELFAAEPQWNDGEIVRADGLA